jgi:hypothetical protein
MTSKRRGLGLALVIALTLSGPAFADMFDGPEITQAASAAANTPLDALTHDVEHLHPIAMMLLAHRLFDADRRDEAVFWFYESQLRWKAHLAQNHSDTEGERFSVLFDRVGPDINVYAFSKPDDLLVTIDKVLDWDARHPDPFTTDAKAKETTRHGLAEFKTYIIAHRAEIDAKNAERARAAAANGGDPYAGDGGAMFGAPGELVPPYNPNAFAAFHVGVTTKADVVRALGKPEMWSTDKDATSALYYSYLRDLGVPSMHMAQRLTVTFRFDAKKVLVGIDLPKGPGG